LNLDEFVQKVEQLEKVMQKKLKGAAARIAGFLEKDTKEILTNYPDGKRVLGGDRKSLVQTGLLRQSIKGSYQLLAVDKVKVILQSENVPYAAIHELGGVIKAKGKYLTIPANKIARNAGKGGKAKGGGLSPRDYPNKLFFKGDGKKGVAIDTTMKPKTKGKNKGEPHPERIAYYLKDQVTIPKRPYMRLAINRNHALIMKIIESLGDGDE